MTFWESSSFWLEAVIAGCAVGAACAVVGVYTILRRVVFLPAALSQISSLGVVLAFVIPLWIPSAEGRFLAGPEVMAGVVTLAASLILGWVPEPRRLGRDTIIGIAYVVSSGLVLVIADKIPQDAHDIKDVLFGNAVAVEWTQMMVAVVVSGGVLLLHAFGMRSFLLASYDPETARAHRVPVRAIDGILFLSLGLTIAVATKTIGAMPVFAFAVLPSAGALAVSHDMRVILGVAGIMGAVSAFLGYWASFALSLPTGPCMAVVAGILAVPGLLMRRR